MSSAPAANEPKLYRTLAPLPQTHRGYGIVLNQSPKDGRLLYACGRLVVLRSIENPADALVFTEHKAQVNVAVFAPSGYWVASGDVEGNVIIWSYPQMKVKNTFQVGKTVNDLDWDESSTRLVAAGDGNQKAKVFSWDSGNNLGEISGISNPVISVSYRKHRPFRIATGSEDLGVNLYEGPPFKFSTTYKGHARYPNCVRFSPDGEHYLSVGSDSKIVLFDGKTGEVKKELESKDNGHKGAIYAFSWSPDSKQILTASADKTAKIWNVASGDVEKTFTFGNDVNDQQVGALWSIGGHLITVSLSGAINYLDINNPATPKLILHGHQSTIQAISLDKKNGCFYTAGLTGEVARWDYATGQAKWLTGKGHNGKVVSGIVVAAGGEKLYSVSLDDKIRTSDLVKQEVSSDGSDLGGQPVAVAAHPTDANIAVAVLAQEKIVVVRNGQAGNANALGFVPTTVSFNQDGSQVLVGGKDKKLHIYTIEGDNVKQQAEITTHDKPLTAIRASHDGVYYASTDKEASVYIHTTAARECKNKSGWRFHQAGVQDADWNPSNTKLVTSSLDTHVIIWNDLKEFNGSDRTRIKDAHLDGANFVRFWDDGTVLSVGADRAIKIWQL